MWLSNAGRLSLLEAVMGLAVWPVTAQLNYNFVFTPATISAGNPIDPFTRLLIFPIS
jgi:hypothetical protein